MLSGKMSEVTCIIIFKNTDLLPKQASSFPWVLPRLHFPTSYCPESAVANEIQAKGNTISFPAHKNFPCVLAEQSAPSPWKRVKSQMKRAFRCCMPTREGHHPLGIIVLHWYWLGIKFILYCFQGLHIRAAGIILANK